MHPLPTISPRIRTLKILRQSGTPLGAAGCHRVLLGAAGWAANGKAQARGPNGSFSGVGGLQSGLLSSFLFIFPLFN